MIGEQILFTVDSTIYRETYESTILDIKDNIMTVAIPYHNGTIVLPGVGTALNVNVPGRDYKFQCEILERSIINKYFKITTPNSISKVNNGTGIRPVRVISVTSGKGGVGKTSFAISFAISLSKLGKRVLIFDGDLGMANIDVLLNIKPKYDILDVISGNKAVKEILLDGPGGIKFIPGASGLQQLAYLSGSQFNRIIAGFNEIEKDFDYMIIDTGAGLSKNVTDFLLACDEIFLVTTTEPHAIMDAYSIIKVMTDLEAKNKISLIVNKCETRTEAMYVFNKMKATSERFLNVDIDYLGYILDDRTVTTSIKNQLPLMLYYPDSPASKCIKDIAWAYTGNLPVTEKPSGIAGFFSKLKKFL